MDLYADKRISNIQAAQLNIINLQFFLKLPFVIKFQGGINFANQLNNEKKKVVWTYTCICQSIVWYFMYRLVHVADRFRDLGGVGALSSKMKIKKKKGKTQHS